MTERKVRTTSVMCWLRSNSLRIQATVSRLVTRSGMTRSVYFSCDTGRVGRPRTSWWTDSVAIKIEYFLLENKIPECKFRCWGHGPNCGLPHAIQVPHRFGHASTTVLRPTPPSNLANNIFSARLWQHLAPKSYQKTLFLLRFRLLTVVQLLSQKIPYRMLVARPHQKGPKKARLCFVQ